MNEIITTRTESVPLLWWDYYQNNSKGQYRGPVRVFVQATSAKEADRLAEESGLVYFDEYRSGDCACCGMRWSAASESWYESKGTPEITRYGEPVDWTTLNAARVMFDGAIEYSVVYQAAQMEIEN